MGSAVTDMGVTGWEAGSGPSSSGHSREQDRAVLRSPLRPIARGLVGAWSSGGWGESRWGWRNLSHQLWRSMLFKYLYASSGIPGIVAEGKIILRAGDFFQI